MTLSKTSAPVSHTASRVAFQPTKLADLDGIIPGLAKVWKQIKADCGTKKRCPSSVVLTTLPSRMYLNDGALGRRYALDLRTMDLSDGLRVSGGEWACHGITNNDQAINGVPDGAAVISCDWNDYYGYFTLHIQVAESGFPKQIGALILKEQVITLSPSLGRFGSRARKATAAPLALPVGRIGAPCGRSCRASGSAGRGYRNRHAGVSEPGRPALLPGMTARFLNLTPHAIVIENGPTVPPSGTVARCSTQSVPAGEHAGVPLFRATYGAVEGLPEPEPGTIYIVSALVRSAVPNRSDVASPGDLIRDEKGTVVGCKGLTVN